MTPQADTTLADPLTHIRVERDRGDLVVDETQGTSETADVHVEGLNDIGKSYGPLVGIRVPEFEQSYGNTENGLNTCGRGVAVHSSASIWAIVSSKSMSLAASTSARSARSQTSASPAHPSRSSWSLSRSR